MKGISRATTFAETGKAECSVHGEHSEWAPYRGHKITKGKLYEWNSLGCRKCDRERQVSWNNTHPGYQDRYRYTRDGTISRALAQAKARARRRSILFDLDAEWVESAIAKQGDSCAYSGIRFDWSGRPKEGKRYRVISIDQRVPGRGYTRANSSLVCWGVNVMKYDMSLPVFRNFCKAIATRTS